MRNWQKYVGILLLLSLFLSLGVFFSAQAAGSRVTGTVWLEKTVDGEMSGESGFSGAAVTLEERQADGSTAAAGRVTTPNSGEFSFSSLRDGEYRLRIEVSSDYRFTLHGLDSDALPAQGNVSFTPFFTVEGGRTVTKNAGVTKNYCTVTVVAFEDLNANGGRMNTEPLIRGAVVEILYEYNGETLCIASSVTDRKGEAIIREFSPGAYRLRVTLPDHYAVGPLGQKINTFYNCILPSLDNVGCSDVFVLEAKETLGMGIGAVRTGSLSGMVWRDENFNGIPEAGEGGQADAIVTLYSPVLQLSRRIITGSDGRYAFDNVRPGDYELRFDLPGGMVFTLPGASLLSQVAPSGSVDVRVQAEVNTSLSYVGVMPAASMTVQFYQDDNLNGVWDAGEAAVPGAGVSARQHGQLIDAAVTDEQGAARFSTLRSGDAELNVNLPEGFIFAPAKEGAFAVAAAQQQLRSAIRLSSGDNLLSVGLTHPASVSGMLFDDPNSNGVLDDGDAPLPGFAVQVLDAAGQIAGQTATDAEGRYAFSSLLPGAYSIRFLLDDSYVATPVKADVSMNRISTQTPAYGETDGFSLAPGQALSDMDGAVFQAGTVDGRVLLGEENKGFPGVTVTLLGSAGTPFSDYSYGITDEAGAFFIKGVLPGTYTLLYTLPDGCVFSSPLLDSVSYESAAFAAAGGSSVHMPDLQGIPTAALAGTILHDDVDLDGPFSARVTLAGKNTGSVYEDTVNEDGAYQFLGLRPDVYTLTVYLPETLVFGQYEGSPITPVGSSHASAELKLNMGDQMLDADILAGMPLHFSGVIFHDRNLTAIQEEEEAGAEGRLISLWAGGQEIESQDTDADGYFSFDHLLPGNYEIRLPLEDHEYVVQPGKPLEDYGIEVTASGSPVWTAAEEAWAAPVSFSEDTDLYIPIMRFASVYGQVWSLDGTENGVSKIPVTLLDASGKAVGARLTGSDGAYAFEGCLLPGEYSFSAVLPDGYLFAGSLDAANRETLIQTQADGTAVSVPFAVAMGDDLSGMDIGIGALGSIGDRAWLDENGNGMQDLGEPNMPGILIELYRNGDLAASTTTDLYGRYLLADLYPGEYEMRVTMHPELKATLHQADFPLVASILPESEETTVSFTGVIVPSGQKNLHCDLGFQLREEGVYPAVMDEIPEKDWRPYSERK